MCFHVASRFNFSPPLRAFRQAIRATLRPTATAQCRPTQLEFRRSQCRADPAAREALAMIGGSAHCRQPSPDCNAIDSGIYALTVGAILGASCATDFASEPLPPHIS